MPHGAAVFFCKYVRFEPLPGANSSISCTGMACVVLGRVVRFLGKRRILFGFMIGALTAAAHSRGGPPINDSVGLNIGLNCQWQRKCMSEQDKAMKRALDYVRKEQPPSWRVHLCNRNASIGRYRVDWIGFNNCIRNTSIKEPPPFRQPKHKHHSTT